MTKPRAWMPIWLAIVGVAALPLNLGVASPDSEVLRSRPTGMTNDEVQVQVSQIGGEVRRALEVEYQINERCSTKWVDLVGRGGQGSVAAMSIIIEDCCRSLVVGVGGLSVNPDPLVREMAATILGHLGDEKTGDILAELIHDSNDRVAAVALRGYCTVDPEACHPLLLALATSGAGWRVRQAAVECSFEAHQEMNARVLGKILRDDAPEVVVSALKGLSCSHLADRGVKRRVLKVAQLADWESSGGVKHAAISALYRCGLKDTDQEAN